MRILKYLLLLILLFSFGMSVFLATQKGSYDVKRSRIINSPRATLYNYINDYKNWEYFYNPTENMTKTTFILSKKTAGIGANFSWQNNDDLGSFTTTQLLENQKIIQQSAINNSISEIHWTFKDTLGKTKVTYRAKGEMPFLYKIKTFLNGGSDIELGKFYEKNLIALDKSLHQELNNYDIVINGQVTKFGNYYAYYPINSKITSISNNFRAIVPIIQKFLQKNNMESKGKPFIIFHKYDKSNNFTNFWVCIELKKEYTTGLESEVLTGKLEPFQAIKATLTGDYSHIDETYKKMDEYFLQKKLKKDNSMPFIALYLKSILEEKKSSQWKTVIYYPILENKKYDSYAKNIQTSIDSTTTIPASEINEPIVNPVNNEN